MSRTYTSSTLEGNWSEDRAPPLKYAVYGDFGFRERGTTSGGDFRRPSEYRAFARQSGGGGVREIGKGVRFGMVTMETLPEARVSYGDGRSGAVKFSGGVGASAALAGEDRTFATETREAFGSGGRGGGGGGGGGRGFLEEKAKRSALMRVAGGYGGERVERGMRTSGSVGEKWMPDAPARSNTAVQRTWVPGGDPGVAATTARATGTARIPKDAPYMSISGLDGKATGRVEAPKGAPGAKTAAWRAPGRGVSVITAGDRERSIRPGYRVFADDD